MLAGVLFVFLFWTSGAKGILQCSVSLLDTKNLTLISKILAYGLYYHSLYSIGHILLFSLLLLLLFALSGVVCCFEKLPQLVFFANPSSEEEEGNGKVIRKYVILLILFF